MPREIVPLFEMPDERNFDSLATLIAGKDARVRSAYVIPIDNPILRKRTVYIEKRPGFETYLTPASGDTGCEIFFSRQTGKMVTVFGDDCTDVYVGETNVGSTDPDFEAPSEFFVYDKDTDRRVVTGSVNGQTWTSYADRITSGGTARYQWAWMRNRQRAGFVSLVGNNPFEYTDDKNQSTWGSVDVHADADTVNTLIYNPTADRLVAIYPGSGSKENAWYSDDGGDTWNVGTKYDTADLGNQLSFGAWGETPGKFVFVKTQTGNGFATIGYHSSTGDGWTRVNDMFGGVTSCHVKAVRYSSTYSQYMCVCNGTAVLNVYPRRFFYSTTGTSFSSVVISADDVGWTDVIEVGGVLIAVAGKDNSGDHKSNLCARSTDGGLNWSVSASMPAERRWSWLAYNGSVIACVPENAAKVAVTTDLGVTWNEYDLPWTPTDARIGAFYSLGV